MDVTQSNSLQLPRTVNAKACFVGSNPNADFIGLTNVRKARSSRYVPGLPVFSSFYIPKRGNIYQTAAKLPNVNNIFQMAIEYNNCFHCQNPPKFTQIWTFCSKTYHLATLLCTYLELACVQGGIEYRKELKTSLPLRAVFLNGFWIVAVPLDVDQGCQIFLGT
jgi:hypothetical protein